MGVRTAFADSVKEMTGRSSVVGSVVQSRLLGDASANQKAPEPVGGCQQKHAGRL